jgi:PAS domain S-box-containing protein
MVEDRELENEFQHIQRRLNHLLAVSPVVIYTARLEFPYPATFISDNVIFQTGYEVREYLEDPDFWLKKTHPDDRALVLSEMARLLAVGKANYEYRFMHKDGTYRWISEGAMVVKGEDDQPEEYFGYFQDITRWREADEANLKSEERYRALAEAAHDFIFVINRDDVVEFVNNYASNAIHIPLGDIIGHSRFKIFPSDVSKKQYNAIQQVLDTGSPSYHEDFIPIGNQKVWLGTWLVPIRDREGKNVSVMGVARDITERIAAEEELQSAFQQEKELSELRSRIVSTISHEFGTPLTTILSSAELLEHYGQGWTETRKQEHYQRIQEAVKRMDSMINRLVEIQRMALKKETSSPSQFELVGYCQEIIEEIEIAAEGRGRTRFTSNIDRISASMDKRLLREALGNLVANALKFSPLAAPVNVEMVSAGEQVSITVQDHGIGIPEKDLPRLYEPFHRGSNTQAVSGKGLGLTIVKNSVALMGGNIQVISKEGAGTTFWLHLPLHQEVPDENNALDDGMVAK